MDKQSQIDERIKNLLTSTDLTFKQIITTLRNENIPASFNTIRRVNRNHRYRKPRYDAKLTPEQRKELLILLKNTAKPNLSSLAKKFGVCHGSIWYWWDKLTKIRNKNNGIIPDDATILKLLESVSKQDLANNAYMYVASPQPKGRQNTSKISNTLVRKGTGLMKNCNGNGYHDIDVGVGLDYSQLESGDTDSDPLDLSEDNKSFMNEKNQVKNGDNDQSSSELDHDSERSSIAKGGNHSNVSLLDDLNMIGRVQAKDFRGNYVDLPILMYAPKANSIPANQAWNLIKSHRAERVDDSSTRGTFASCQLSDQVTSSFLKRLQR